jgi:hypothetical protein
MGKIGSPLPPEEGLEGSVTRTGGSLPAGVSEGAVGQGSSKVPIQGVGVGWLLSVAEELWSGVEELVTGGATAVGCTLGPAGRVGREVGAEPGGRVTREVGAGVMIAVGRGVDPPVGTGVGLAVGTGVGFGVGTGVGTGVGLGVGTGVGVGGGGVGVGGGGGA